LAAIESGVRSVKRHGQNGKRSGDEKEKELAINYWKELWVEVRRQL